MGQKEGSQKRRAKKGGKRKLVTGFKEKSWAGKGEDISSLWIGLSLRILVDETVRQDSNLSLSNGWTVYMTRAC